MLSRKLPLLMAARMMADERLSEYPVRNICTNSEYVHRVISECETDLDSVKNELRASLAELENLGRDPEYEIGPKTISVVSAMLPHNPEAVNAMQTEYAFPCISENMTETYWTVEVVNDAHEGPTVAGVFSDICFADETVFCLLDDHPVVRICEYSLYSGELLNSMFESASVCDVYMIEGGSNTNGKSRLPNWVVPEIESDELVAISHLSDFYDSELFDDETLEDPAIYHFEIPMPDGKDELDVFAMIEEIVAWMSYGYEPDFFYDIFNIGMAVYDLVEHKML